MQCSLCGARISPKAKRCDHCGTSTQKKHDTLRTPLGTQGGQSAPKQGPSEAQAVLDQGDAAADVGEPKGRFGLDALVAKIEDSSVGPAVSKPAVSRPVYGLVLVVGLLCILGLAVGMLYLIGTQRQPKSQRIAAPAPIETREATLSSAPRVDSTTISRPAVREGEGRGAAANIEQELAQLETPLGPLSEKEVWQNVEQLRQSIRKITSPNQREQLGRRLDKLIVATLDREGQKLVDEATSLFNSRDFDGALEKCREVSDFYARPEIPTPSSPGDESSVASEARRLAVRAARFADPAQRYTIQGFGSSGGRSLATLRDNATGKVYHVERGGNVGVFTLEAVDMQTRTVTLQGPGGRVTLYR